MVYLAGPITPTADRSLLQNIAQANEVYRSLVADGALVYCPHLSTGTRLYLDESWVGLNRPETYDLLRISEEVWMQLGKRFIMHATHLLMLPGWQQSAGSQEEHEFASQIGKLIFYDENSLRASIGIRPRKQPAHLPA